MDEWTKRGGGYDSGFIRDLDELFGGRARQRREFLQYSQGIVATLMATTYGIKWHQTVVAKIESGERKVKLSEAYALADIYGMPLEELAQGTNLDHVWHWRREERDGRFVTVGKRGPRIAGPATEAEVLEREDSAAHLAGLEADVREAQERSN